MAAPLKRVCQQVARHTSQHTRSRILQPCRATNTQCQTQWRSYQTSRTSSAAAQLDEIDEDDFDGYLEALDENLPNEGELPSMAHAELEQHRELREMVRVAAWEMPLLSNLAKEYEPIKKTELPLRFRYTTYFSESHPASRKVVCEFYISHLSTNAFSQDKSTRLRQIEKLKKLCGARYNPQKEMVKMSCESFETQAQNKRYLLDTINKLVAEAKDLESGDNFEDVPLDTRHHKYKVKLKFPNDWKITEKNGRQAELDEKRRALLLEEGKRVEENRVVSGAMEIERDRKERLSRVEEPVTGQARQSLPRGKMGRKEMGQRGRS